MAWYIYTWARQFLNLPNIKCIRTSEGGRRVNFQYRLRGRYGCFLKWPNCQLYSMSNSEKTNGILWHFQFALLLITLKVYLINFLITNCILMKKTEFLFWQCFLKSLLARTTTKQKIQGSSWNQQPRISAGKCPAVPEILVEYFCRKSSHILQEIFVIFVKIVCWKPQVYCQDKQNHT